MLSITKDLWSEVKKVFKPIFLFFAYKTSYKSPFTSDAFMDYLMLPIPVLQYPSYKKDAAHAASFLHSFCFTVAP